MKLRPNQLLIILVILKLALPYILQSFSYEPHRDEFLYLEQGHHMAWGYMEVPPVLSVFAWLTHAFGDGMFWIKLWPSLFGAATFIVAGRIESISTTKENTFCINYRERSSKNRLTIFADAVINCMGPESDYEKLDDPLIKNLLKRGMIKTDQLKLGLDCTPEGIIIDKSGKRSPFLYTIGPPAKSTLFEITSVPEIRIAALQLADLVTSKQDELAY